MNREISEILYDIAKILEFNNENIFRVRAYQNAARVIESYHKDVGKLTLDELKKIPGIGESIAKKIIEYSKTKKIKEYEELKKNVPQGVLEVMDILGLGPKRARVLYDELKIDSIQKLKDAAINGKLRNLKGFGKKTEENILKSLELKTANFLLLWDAIKISDEIIDYIKSSCAVDEILAAGSIRRKKEKIGDIDILVVSGEPEKVMERFTVYKDAQRVLAKGLTKSQILLKNGIQCDLRIVEKKSFGSALMYFTGSKEHNIALRELALKKNYTLSEYGLFASKTKKYIEGRTEEAVYKKLGLNYIPPEVRENTGEIDFAMKNKFPEFIKPADMKGDFHTHTKRTDGFNSDEEMILKAIDLGYEWIAIGDHTKSTRVAGGLDEEEFLQKYDELMKLKKKYSNKIEVLVSMEVDILDNGELDYPPEILKKIDCVIGAIHSGFKQDKNKLTERIVKAIESGMCHIIAHPSGRLITSRPPYEIDYERIFEKAIKHSVAIEINSQPERMDLDWRYLRSYGGYLAINSDAHSTSQMEYVKAGVYIARKGWIEKERVINTLGADEVKKWLKR